MIESNNKGGTFLFWEREKRREKALQFFKIFFKLGGDALQNTQEDRLLLRDYLIRYAEEEKRYNKSKAIDFAKYQFKKYKDNLFGQNSLAVWLGEKSIEFFCLFFLRDTFVPTQENEARELSQKHYELWSIMEDMFIRDKFDKFEGIYPRGFAKTTVCDFAIGCWVVAYKKITYTLVCGKTEQDAVQFISDIKQAFMENARLIYSFGELIDSKKFTVNKLEIEFAHGVKVQAISSTGSIRGKKYKNVRPGLIIADDYQGKDDVITEQAREKKFAMWEEDTKYAGDKPVYRNGEKIKWGTKYIVLGTILHSDCFMSRIYKKPGYVKVKEKAVMVDDVDTHFNSRLWAKFKSILFNTKLSDPESHAKEFYYQHEEEMQYQTLWPDKWTCLETALDYFDNPTGFKKEMQNDAKGIGEKYFHSQAVKSPEDIEENTFLKTMICVDPKGTNNKNKKKEDYFSLVVGGMADNGFKYIREGIIKKIEYDDYIKTVIEKLIDYPEVQHVYIEKNTYMGADVIKLQEEIAKIPELSNRRIEFINEMQRKNKDKSLSSMLEIA